MSSRRIRFFGGHWHGELRVLSAPLCPKFFVPRVATFDAPREEDSDRYVLRRCVIDTTLIPETVYWCDRIPVPAVDSVQMLDLALR